RQANAVAVQRGMRISHHRTDGDAAGYGALRDRHAEGAVGRQSFRQQPDRSIEQPAELLIPAETMDVEELGARSVAEIRGVHLAAGEFGDKPGIDCSCANLAGFRRVASTGNVIEKPTDLCGRKERIEAKPRSGFDKRLDLRAVQWREPLGRAPALPSHTRSERLTSGAIPEQNGFTLVRNANRGKLDVRSERQTLGDRRLNRLPDGLTGLFRPTGLGMSHRQRNRGARNDGTGGVDQERLGVCRALVNGEDAGGHAAFLASRVSRTAAAMPLAVRP